jgi:hypothetical protein
MNLFACNSDPVKAAQALPDKHVVKMCIENAQMLAVALGDLHGLGWGQIRKKDGSFYSQRAHFNHPSTVWVRASHANLAWAIVHGLALCAEYTHRYGKIHASVIAHLDAKRLFTENAGKLSIWCEVESFARAMPEEIKYDASITDVDAYRKYLTLHKPWAVWKIEARKPTWWNPSYYEECRSQITESRTSKTESLSFQSSTISSKKL